MAWVAVVAGGALGVTISAAFGMSVLLLGIGGYATGLAYDVFMRRLGLGWLCFAAAFPILIAWVWVAAAGTLPPGSIALLPLAALAGPAIHLANSLVDPAADVRSGIDTVATRLGPERGIRLLALLQALVFGLGWVTLGWMGGLQPGILGGAALATALVVVGVFMSGQASRKIRDLGWMVQALAVALLGAGWLAAIAVA
jgi:4-hydroxybenzoate polyprenyltransferase